MVTDGMPGVMAPLSGFKSPTRRTWQRDHSQTGTSRELVMAAEPDNEPMVPADIVVSHTGVAKPPTPEVRPLIPPYPVPSSYSVGAFFVTPRPSQPWSTPHHYSIKHEDSDHPD
jgi:hypothetical protein